MSVTPNPPTSLFDVAFRDASIGMALIAPSGAWLDVNPALCRLLGRDRAAMMAQPAETLADTGDWQRNVDALRATLEAGETHYSVDQRYRHADGHHVPTRIDVSVVRDAQGRLAYMLAQVQDLSDQMEAQDARDAFFDVAPDPLAVVDADGVIEAANPAWASVLDWTAEQLHARPLHTLLHPGDLPADERERCLVMIAGRRTRVRRGDGEYRWVDWSVRAGTRGRWFCAARDVTAEHEAELRRQRDHAALAARVATDSAALSEAHARLSLHTDSSPLATIEWDRELRVIQWSARAEALFGWRAEEVMGRRPSEWTFVPAEDEARVGAAIASLFQGVPRLSMINRNYTRDGAVLSCEWHNSVLYDSRGNLTSVLSLVHDVSAQIATERALRDRDARFRATFEQSAVGFAHLDPDGSWRRVNQRLCEMLGYSEDELQHMRFADLTHPDDLASDLAQTEQLMAGTIPRFAMEKRYVRKNGEVFWANLNVSLRRDDDGAPMYFMAVIENIQARKLAEHALHKAHHELEEKVAERTRELERLALTLQEQASQDALTGLANRRALLERLERAIDRARRYGSLLALLFIDLDRFKSINDRHGHDAGDDVLKTCAARLVSQVRSTDIVARLGGDEFVVVLEQLRETVHIEALAEKLRAALVVPISIKGVSHSLSASIGISLYERDGTTAEQLLQRADRKMYAAKAVGGDAVRSELGPHARAASSRTDMPR